MHEGTWTISPCPHRVQAELAEALGISELTASVLVRRGLHRLAEARAFLDGELAPHDPFLLGDMGLPARRIRAAVAAGRRICVHGDYDVDGIAATTLAVLLAARARGGRRLAPAEPLRRGLRRAQLDARAPRRRGLRARPHGRLRHHGRRGGRRGEGARPRGRRHRPSPARCVAARLSDRRRRARPTIRFRSSAAPASSTSSARRCFGVDSAVPEAASRPRRARDDRRCRAARSTRTAAS